MRIKKIYIILMSFLVLFLIKSTVFAGFFSESFDDWLADFKDKVLARPNNTITMQTIDMAFANVKYKEKVVKLDKSQPEFMKTFWDYYKKSIDNVRVSKGKKMMKKFKTVSSNAEKKYGIQREYIMAFWGLETNYGQNFGGFNVIDALSTLAYDGRRRTFFEKELIYALEILQNKDINIKDMKGSWAGAMGNFQFMPSTFRSYAVDGNGDGKKNIWKDHYDAFYSAGNFLKKIGWKKGQRWGREVKLPSTFNWHLTGESNKKTVTFWKNKGVRKANGSPLPNSQIKGAIVAPMGKEGPIFLVYNNFFVIKRWNNSTYYAISVGRLADRINGWGKLSVKENINEKITTKQIIDIQKKLSKTGYYKKDDFRGILNKATKASIKKFQSENGLIPDAYPNYKTYLAIMKYKQVN